MPNGVRLNNISVYNDLTGDWVSKITRSDRLITNSMYPEWWTENRIKVENDFAYLNRIELPNSQGVYDIWEGRTLSGIEVRGYLTPDITVFPKIIQD